MSELPKGFDHAQVDAKWYEYWERTGAFRADPSLNRPHFSMVLPPPNVTGSLHIGHALNQTLPDIIVRWKRMQGFDVLWLPGTDHAGIATQNVVEKQLAKEGKTRHDLGREAFEAKVWEWVKQSHGTITSQMRKLGASVDWSRERFTLDPPLSAAVRKVFVSLFNEGLIYRGAYLVNWCPRCRTALSDLEVVHKEVAGKLYYIRYPRVDAKGSVTVATTRPETMLGDTAVAVNPDDERFKGLVGAELRLPVIGRLLPVIADALVDPEFGTGAVKVTPAHDPNDFQMGQRHNLPQVSVIDEDARMTDEAGPYAGQDRFKARAALVGQLERDGFLEKVEEHRHAVGHCDRCGTVVEPLVSTQWFVRVAPLAAEAIKVVENGLVRFVPENWTKTYFEWMTNIHDWCISRQLWWGHRIPAWYCNRCSKMIVAEDTPAQCPCGGALTQDTDVLDTWFSSALWPFTTLGWPDQTEDLKAYYPTTLLITGLDIIFFWVARMIMLGVKFGGHEELRGSLSHRVPFREVYITALVRDERGQKMSKSKGNVVDPLELMDEIGADAFRFTLAAMASPGMDIALSEGRLRGYRQFINKIWNASRFVLMNIVDVKAQPALKPAHQLALIHRWILHRLNHVTHEVNQALGEYRFDVAADRLYHFLWHEYADWYVELVKPHLQAEGPEREDATGVLVEVHDRMLRLLHPFIPFITEELWQQLPRTPEERSITLARFPQARGDWTDADSAAAVELLQDVVTGIRTVRAEKTVAPGRRIRVVIEAPGARHHRVLQENTAYLTRLAGLEDAGLTFAEAAVQRPGTVVRVVRDFRIHVDLAGGVDHQAEKEKILRELAKIQKETASLDSKLSNSAFVERAPGEVVSATRAHRQSLDLRREKLESTLKELDG